MRRIESRKIDVNELKKFDKLSNLFVKYDDESLSDLTNFISDSNDCQPIIVDKTFRMVDGYNRYEACLKSGVKEIQIDIYDYKDEDEMIRHAIILNAKRRHLDTVSLSRYVKQLAELMRPAMEANLKLVLSEAGRKGQKSKIKIKEEGVEDTNDTDKNARGESLISKASKEFGISQATVFQVKAVDDLKDHKLTEAMEKRDISVRKAFEISKIENPEERQEKLDEVIAKNASPKTRKPNADKKADVPPPPKVKTIGNLAETISKARMLIEKVLEGIEWDNGTDEDYLKIKDEIMSMNKIIIFSADRIRASRKDKASD
ncbi:MAG: ParB N-terminal domain-containing protein [Lentisphaerota bacterium]